MADWENEDVDQEENKGEQKPVIFNEFDDESEVIPEEKKIKTETIKPKDKEEINYEKNIKNERKKISR